MNEQNLQPIISDEELARLRNIFADHSPVTLTQKHYGKIRESCLELAITITHLTPQSRERSLALTHLEEVMFWANAGIARNN